MARSTTTPSTTALAPLFEHPALPVPAETAAALGVAADAGIAAAASWTGTTGKAWAAHAKSLAGRPPDATVQASELKHLHHLQSTRTSADVEAAVWLGANGIQRAWTGYIAEYARRTGPDQAAAAQRLVDATIRSVHEISETAKNQWARPRPFQTDPTLKPVVKLPTNLSFPSGHSAGAFAAATVLSRLLPDRATELRDLAAQVCQSRMVGGVHYPSDTTAGARLGAFIGASLMARASDVRPAPAPPS